LSYAENYKAIDWSKDLMPKRSKKNLLRRNGGVISDDLGQQLEHHGYSDGRRTDSKSVFRRWTKEAGLVEKGNDRDRAPRRQGDALREVIRDVAEATQMVKAGYKPQIRHFEE